MDATDLYIDLGDVIGELLANEAEAEWVKVKTKGPNHVLDSDIFKITVTIEEK